MYIGNIGKYLYLFSTEKSDLKIKLTNRDIYVNCDHFMYFLVCKNRSNFWVGTCYYKF